MSAAAQEPDTRGASRPLLEHEIRRDGRVIATLSARRTKAGVTVDSTVFAVTKEPGAEGINRPFTFPTVDHARRFVDEALVAFEYLNCTVA